MLRLYTCSRVQINRDKRLRRANQLCSDADDDRDTRVNLSQGKIELVRDN